MANDLTFHEQQEGWGHEWLTDKHCVCIMRPQELGGGFVTVDFERRLFGSGYGKPRQGASDANYGGKGWKDRIVRDAIDHLERTMNETAPSGPSAGARFSKSAMIAALRDRAERIRRENGFDPNNGTSQLKGPLATLDAAVAYGEFRTCLDLVDRIEDGSLFR
jgi:hypothetical protein